MSHIRPLLGTRLPSALLGLAVGIGLAGPARGQVPAPTEAGMFTATDSTLVVVVPAGASATSVLGAVRAVRGRTVTAVYTTDDAAARQLGTALATAVGGSLIPYDRAGATPRAYAARLLRNAVAANPHGAVLIVGDAALTDPLYRAAAAASGVATTGDARVGGAPNGVVVLGVAPRTGRLVRDRL